MPARCANSSLARCGRLPTTVAWSTWPGFALASAMRSATLWMSLSGLTTSTTAPRDSNAIGAKIPLHVEGRIGIDDLIDDDGQGRQEQRVAVIGSVSDIVGGDARAAARLVLDRDLLSQQRSHALAQQAPGDVGRRAWCKADDEMDGTRRIGFRPSKVRHSRQRACAGCQMQKFAAG